MYADGIATFSGCSALSVFGAISPKIRMKMVSTPVVAAIHGLPYSSRVMMVAIAVDAECTAMLPSRIMPISRSGRSSSFSASLRTAMSGLRHVAQPITVERHQRRFRTGEERR